jgi:transcriptional regulator with XRE-family HTH domain
MTTTAEDQVPHAIDRLVGLRIRMRRKELRLSQGKLAAELRLTFQQVQKYERGDNRVSASKLWEIARALDVPIRYFFEGSDEELQAANDPFPSPDCAQFLLTPEGAELSRMFPTLKTSHRKKVLDLVRAIAAAD